jgi:hypothetical protein
MVKIGIIKSFDVNLDVGIYVESLLSGFEIWDRLKKAVHGNGDTVGDVLFIRCRSP